MPPPTYAPPPSCSRVVLGRRTPDGRAGRGNKAAVDVQTAAVADARLIPRAVADEKRVVGQGTGEITAYVEAAAVIPGLVVGEIIGADVAAESSGHIHAPALAAGGIGVEMGIAVQTSDAAGKTSAHVHPSAVSSGGGVAVEVDVGPDAAVEIAAQVYAAAVGRPGCRETRN